jgi:hypothetical protein
MAVALGDTIHVRIEPCKLGAVMADTQPRYRAFLLRLWQERSGGKWVWRASLEDGHSHVRKGFADLERLYTYLSEQTEDDANQER